MAAFQEGDIVDARWKSGEATYRGRIVAVNADGSYGVTYNDGDRDDAVPACDVTAAVRVQVVPLSDDDSDELDLNFMESDELNMSVFRVRAIKDDIDQKIQKERKEAKAKGKRRRRKSLHLAIKPPVENTRNIMTPLYIQSLSPLQTPGDQSHAFLGAVSKGDLPAIHHLYMDMNEDAVDTWLRSPLMVCAKRGHVDAAAYLVGRGSDVSKKSRFGQFPLMWSAYHATTPAGDRSEMHFNLVVLLLSLREATNDACRSDSYIRNALGETVAHVLARNDDSELIEMFQAFDYLPVMEKNSQGKTALEVAASTDCREALERKADAMPSLQAACTTGSMLQVRATYCATSADSVAALHDAVEAGNDKVLAFLLSKGVDMYTAGDSGLIPLHRAASLGHRNVFRLLQTHDMLRQTRDGPLSTDGQTVISANGDNILHHAVRGGSVEIVTLCLHMNSASRDTLLAHRNNQGQTPLELAASPKIVDAINQEFKAIAHVTNLPTPTPFAPGSGIVCAVCLLTTPSQDDTFAHVCDCQAAFCEECFVHLCQSSINEGVFPSCCNGTCQRKISMGVLRKFLPISQLLLTASIAVNAHITVENAYSQNCGVCNRVNDLRDSFTGSSPRRACDHCGVFRCAVCSNVHPRKEAPPGSALSVAQRMRNADDDLIHADCVEKFATMKEFNGFYDLLESQALRFCPSCSQGGVKNDACTHMSSCCGTYWCYVCGKTNDMLPEGVTVSEHGEYGGTWMQDPTQCPMYMSHLARVDPRVAALGCGDSECRPNGSCPDGTCNNVRDQFGAALVATMRVRYHILQFAKRMGKAKFVEMLMQYGFQGKVDELFFNKSFPWQGDELPTWDSFEPEEMRQFYRKRLVWMSPKEGDIPDPVHPEDLVEDVPEVVEEARPAAAEEGELQAIPADEEAAHAVAAAMLQEEMAAQEVARAAAAAAEAAAEAAAAVAAAEAAAAAAAAAAAEAQAAEAQAAEEAAANGVAGDNAFPEPTLEVEAEVEAPPRAHVRREAERAQVCHLM